MEAIILAIFVLGYLSITLEHTIRINKAATALVTGVLCWTVFMVSQPESHAVNEALETHLGEISGILFFLLGAMVIVELVDAHDGFDIITERIKTVNKTRLLWIICSITFFLSAILDNLTTTIVMVSLVRKLVADREDRLLFVGMIVVSANAGGAFSPLGDVTTTMLWIGGQITASNIIRMLFLPSLVCMTVPLLLLSFRLKGTVSAPVVEPGSTKLPSTAFERNTVFCVGIGSMLFVPVFKTLTHLPPFMGMLMMLGVMWITTEMIHAKKDESEKGLLSVQHALRKIDTPSILFFMGILLAVSVLQTAGILPHVAEWLDQTVGNLTIIGIIIGFFSAIVDNVPLVAAAQGMYSLEQYHPDHFFWEFLAYCTGTGGSALIIGSAAGVAAMGMEQIEFGWYLKRISWLAIAGYLAGAAVYILQFALVH